MSPETLLGVQTSTPPSPWRGLFLLGGRLALRPMAAISITIGFRLLGGAISDGRDHVFFVEERSHPFLRDSPLKYGREGGIDHLERQLGFVLKANAIGRYCDPLRSLPPPNSTQFLFDGACVF